MVKTPTEIGIIYGDPLDRVYVHPPLEDKEIYNSIDQGIFLQEELNRSVGAKDPMTLIDVGRFGVTGTARRERGKQVAQDLLRVLSSSREKVSLNPSVGAE
jgi:hypothetical protein